MLVRYRIITKSFKIASSIFSNNRPFIITHHSHPCKKNHNNLNRSPPAPKNFKQFSSSQQPSNKKKYVPVIICLAAGAGIGVYAYSTKTQKSDKVPLEDDYEEPFINETFEEDIKLLNEFGPVPFLLVGAGSASFAAFRAIRTENPTAKVLIVGEEPFHPYMRRPLSKELWFDQNPDVVKTLSFTHWNGKEHSVFYAPQDYYVSVKDLLENKNGGVAVICGKKVVKIDPVSQLVFLDSGDQIAYEKCLLATGAKPKNLPLFEDVDDSVKKHITLFRSVRDFQKLDRISRKVKSVAIIGGGFLGSELACGLVKRSADTGLNVIQIFPESGNMGKVLPEYLSKWTTKALEKKGVNVMPNVSIKAVNKKDKKIKLHLSNDKIISVDHVVVAVGAEPNTEIAKSSGLEMDNKYGGFLVNAEMEAHKNLWVAGDAIYGHAVVSGRLAGENMAGSSKPYRHPSMFSSYLGPDIGFDAIGIVDSSLPTLSVLFTEVTEKDTVISVGDATEQSICSEAKVLAGVLLKKVTEKDAVISVVGVEGQVPRAPDSGDNCQGGVLFYFRDGIIVGLLFWIAYFEVKARKIEESKSDVDIDEVAFEELFALLIGAEWLSTVFKSKFSSDSSLKEND